MSYLDGPQLVFSGEFQADVSTVNNDVRHFDNERFEARFQRFREGAKLNGWWNPIGSGAFRLLNCEVRRAVDVDGSAVDDLVVGAGIGGSSDRVAAKMVDLDPQWQLSSELWGLRVEVVAGGEVLLAGRFEPAGFRDLWTVPRTAQYISVLTGVAWPEAGRSPFVDALRAATAGDLLSIRLVTFAHDGNHLSPRFTIGTVLGAIGPYRSGEPRHFVRGRRFAPRGFPPRLVSFFYGQVVAGGEAVAVDLGNALPVLDHDGRIGDIGAIRLGLLLRDLDEGDAVDEGPDFVALGEPIPYRESGWLRERAGIVRIAVPAAASDRLGGSPLALIGPGPDGGSEKVLIRETPGGWHVRADEDLHRVDAGGSATVSIHVSRFGAPVSGAEVAVLLRPPQDGLGGGPATDPDPPTAPIPRIGRPASAVRQSSLLPTDEAGRTACTIECFDPGNPRGYLDGQLYQFRVVLPGIATREHPFDNVSVVVYDGGDLPDQPTWEDVAGILTQYGNLYPIMSHRLVNLGDLDAVRENRQLLRFAFALDIADPNHMPVTRDLSGPKRAMILRWLDSPELARDEPGPPTRARTLRTSVRPAPTTPASERASVEAKEEFARRYLDLPATPVEAGADPGAET